MIWHGRNLARREAEGKVLIDCQFTEYLRNPNSATLVFQSSIAISKLVHECWKPNMKAETRCTTLILPMEQPKSSPLYESYRTIFEETLKELSDDGKKGVPSIEVEKIAKWQP